MTGHNVLIPPEFSDPKFDWIVGYWQARCSASLLPGRNDFDPIDFPKLLGWIALIDVDEASCGIEYRIRLWGSKLTQIFGKDHTGKRLEDLAIPGTFADLRKRFDACVNLRRPIFQYREISLDSPENVSTCRVLLPLAKNGADVNLLFSVVLPAR